jgi:Tol biopolymer transport system component
MIRSFLLFGAAALAACSPSVWRPIQVTEAAAELEQVTRSRDNELDPAVSPDAKAIAYEVAPSPEAPARVEVMSLEDLRPDRPATIEYTSEVTGLEPAWKPDGSGLFFLSPRPRSTALVVMLGLGVGRGPLVADVGEVSFAGEWPAVSPDGSTIAMSVANTAVFHTGWHTARYFDHALGFSDLGGGGIRVSGEGTEPAWSPDGKRLVFVRASGGHAHLFVAGADGAGAQQITEGPSDDEEPSWSPDGKLVVFCSTNAMLRSTTQADLFTVRPDGSGLVQLTEGDRYACHPTWGHDGFIYFHVNADARFHIWRLRPGGAGERARDGA